MSEDEWNACDDPIPMLRFVQARTKLSDRKARLLSEMLPLWFAGRPPGRPLAARRPPADNLECAVLTCHLAGVNSS